MLKKIKIPLVVSDQLFIYSGPRSWKTFYAKAKAAGAEVDDDDTILSGAELGRQYQNYIWVADKNDRLTLIHEIIHYLNRLFNAILTSDEQEFKAYLSAWLINEVLKWRDSNVNGNKQKGDGSVLEK